MPCACIAASSALRLNWGLKRLYGAERTSASVVTPCCLKQRDEPLQRVVGVPDGQNARLDHGHGAILTVDPVDALLRTMAFRAGMW